MSQKTGYILKALYVLSWIIFIGLCIEAGGFIVNTIATLALTPEGAVKFWKEVDLTALYHHDQSHFVVLASIMIIATVLKALMFYFIVKIFHTKEINLSKPFNEKLRRYVVIIAYLALGIGIFSFWGIKFAGQLVNEGVKLPDILHLRLGGADVWLFMAVTLLAIAFIFKKAVEIQNENDLTV